MNWYEGYIEENIRNEVKLLRDNGFNTESSCHHGVCVQCQLIVEGELQRLHNLLFDNGYRNYTVEMTLSVVSGCSCSSMLIKFNDKLKVKNKND